MNIYTYLGNISSIKDNDLIFNLLLHSNVNIHHTLIVAYKLFVKLFEVDLDVITPIFVELVLFKNCLNLTIQKKFYMVCSIFESYYIKKLPYTYWSRGLGAEPPRPG